MPSFLVIIIRNYDFLLPRKLLIDTVFFSSFVMSASVIDLKGLSQIIEQIKFRILSLKPELSKPIIR